MKIVVNTRLLLKNRLEGIGWFTFETLKRITANHPEHQFYFLFDRPYSEEFIFSKNITPIVIGPQARHPILFYLWFEFSVFRVLKKLQPDLFLSPDGYLSLRTRIPSLAVIHDLNFEHYPADLPLLIRKYYRHYFPRFAKKAVRIATVSEFSKQDINSLYHVDKDSIDVVYNGVNESYQPLSSEAEIETRKKYTNGSEYFIFIGALHPRKNLKNLFLAYDRFRSTYPDSDHKLVIAGVKQWWRDDIEAVYSIMKYRNDVIFTGRVKCDELNSLLGASVALIYVSLFEGFGIPILEAFACGTAVITSNVTSMPEVAAGAGMLVSPELPELISDAMRKLSTDKIMREELIRKGRERMKDFSWDRTADLLWDSITKSLNKGH